MSIPYLTYKRNELNLQDRFGDVPVRVEEINPADVYYTDGDAEESFCKLIIGGGYTVYLPQIIYSVLPEHRIIIEEWIQHIKLQG